MKDKIVLVTPNWRWDTHPLPVDTLLVPQAPPLEWAYVMSTMRDQYSVHFIDCYVEDLTPTGLSERFADINPDFIIISTAPSLLFWRCPPMSIEAACKVVSCAKATCGAGTVLVGPHGTHSAEWAVMKSGADFVFRGAPEFGLLEFLSDQNAMSANVNSTVTLSLAKNLPVADFSVFDWELGYRPHMWSVTDKEISDMFGGRVPRSAILEASRGCPWSCAYCAKRPVRDLFSQRDLCDIEAELKQLLDAGVQYVFFADETFNHNLRKVRPVLKLIQEYGLSFGFQGRADLLTDEFASELAAHGCIYAELGIDTASDTLSHIVSRNQKIEKCEEGVGIAVKHLPITRFNRINLSTIAYRDFVGGDIEHDWSTPADPTYPYPGSVLGDWWWSKNSSGEFDWDQGRYYSWWLRLEVYLQRNRPEFERSDLEALQNSFLRSDASTKEIIARIVEGIVRDQDYTLANKIARGQDGHVRSHHSSKK
jgi:hypothetical protein